LVRKIEQRRDMPTRDNATLANLELPGIDHGERMFAFIHDRPSFFAPCHPLAKVARISYGKFDQLPSPIQPARTIVVSAAGREPTLRSDRCRAKVNLPFDFVLFTIGGCWLFVTKAQKG